MAYLVSRVEAVRRAVDRGGPGAGGRRASPTGPAATVPRSSPAILAHDSIFDRALAAGRTSGRWSRDNLDGLLSPDPVAWLRRIAGE